jgi:hypothetical protein
MTNNEYASRYSQIHADYNDVVLNQNAPCTPAMRELAYALMDHRLNVLDALFAHEARHG